MSELPLAVRIAAGLAATAVERARKLPQDLAELPVTAVSQALQVSMRVQQRITDLAIKGDNAIAQLRSPAEEPPWAVFDEDFEQDVRGPRADLSPVAPAADSHTAEAALAREWYDAEYDDEPYGADAPDIVVEVLEADAGPPDTAAEPPDTTAEPPDTTAETTDMAAGAAEPGGRGPGVLPTYPELSLASVRARLRTFDADDLQALLDYELAHAARPEFVRMLTNRIGTVRDQ